ncbi:MAG: putative PEP-binding protein [Polyangiales bacterium]
MEQFVEHADFLAVGTNDLAHCTLAVDRGNGRRSADPLDPAVLFLLDRIISASTGAGVPCSMCGDMVADPVGLGLALGLGYREISVPVSVVPLARAVVRHIDLRTAEAVARDALRCDSARAVRSLVERRLSASLSVLWRKPSLV